MKDSYPARERNRISCTSVAESVRGVRIGVTGTQIRTAETEPGGAILALAAETGRETAIEPDRVQARRWATRAVPRACAGTVAWDTGRPAPRRITRGASTR